MHTQSYSPKIENFPMQMGKSSPKSNALASNTYLLKCYFLLYKLYIKPYYHITCCEMSLFPQFTVVFLIILILLSLSSFFRVAGLCQEGERQLPGYWWVSGTYKGFIWLHVAVSCKHDRSCLTAKYPRDLPELMCACWFRKTIIQVFFPLLSNSPHYTLQKSTDP